MERKSLTEGKSEGNILKDNSNTKKLTTKLYRLVKLDALKPFDAPLIAR